MSDLQLIIEADKLRKTYHTEGEDVHALRDVSFTVERGEFVSIIGPSGCGKSTLLYLLGGLTTPTAGTVRIGGEILSGLPDSALSRVRAKTTGFVFQRFNLIPTLSILDNIRLAQGIRGADSTDGMSAGEIISRVGLSGKESRRPPELSMGEQQRAAIARAVAHLPAILLADEPTGNLDTSNSEQIVSLFLEMNRSFRQTILLVTHNRDVAESAGRIIWMRDGRIVDNTRAADRGM